MVIEVKGITSVYDLNTTRIRSGVEVFSQLFEVGEEGDIDWDWEDVQ